MRSLKRTSILSAAVFFLFCFAGISLGFNPQPEPPALSQQTLPGTDTVKPPGNAAGPAGLGPEGITETNPDNIKIIPTMQGTFTDTKPLNLQGSPKMMEPLDKQHSPEPGSPQMMRQTMPGQGSEKMEEEEEEQQHGMKQGMKMMDQGEAGGPGGPQMMDQGDGGSPGGPKMRMPDDSPGDPVMNDPGEGPAPGTKSQKRMNRQMRRY